MSGGRSQLVLIGAGLLVLASGCGSKSHSLVTPTQLQKAFVHTGLRTRVVIDCFDDQTSVTKRPCALRGLVGPHVVGFVAYYPQGVGSPSIAAYVFDSRRAAQAFEVATAYLGADGRTYNPELRLQRNNVVVYVPRRRSDYRHRVETALATLD